MSQERIDWSQFWYPGPARIFTPEELARAGGQQPSRTMVAIVTLNVAIVAMMVMQAAPPQATAQLTAILAVTSVAGLQFGRRLWRQPTRRALNIYCGVLALACGIVVGFLADHDGDRAVRRWLIYTCASGALLVSLSLWFLAVFRSAQIAARLRELDDQDRAVDMAQQLAAAQIQPHFLFNSLASLQHWVQQKDDRAAPMLEALTAFLRATLPLFNRHRLRLGDEAEAVHQYFEVMRLRLGDRLRYRIEITPAAAAVQVPPGLLLTLVENAIEHGVQASLGGGEVQLQADVVAGQLGVEVRDPGPGPAPNALPGVGLANSRTRLQQAFGPHATITLSAAPGGGGLARIDCPLPTRSAP